MSFETFDEWFDRVNEGVEAVLGENEGALLTFEAQQAGFFNDYCDEPDRWTDAAASDAALRILAQSSRDQQFLRDARKKLFG